MQELIIQIMDKFGYIGISLLIAAGDSWEIILKYMDTYSIITV